MPRGRKPKTWAETAPSQRRHHGRQVSVYFRPEEYDLLLQSASTAGMSVSQYVTLCTRTGSPELREASAASSRSMALRLAHADREIAQLRAENARLQRAAQPEVRIGQRGTTGDLYFSLPLYLIERAIKWGTEEVESLEREMKRTRDRERRSAIPKEIGMQQSAVDIFEAMAVTYRDRRKGRAV